MPEQATCDDQTFASHEGVGGKRVTKIVEPNVLWQSGERTDLWAAAGFVDTTLS